MPKILDPLHDTKPHPAPYSFELLLPMALELRGCNTILDPMAGIGRVHLLQHFQGIGKTVGVEIEEEWAIASPETIHGSLFDLDRLGLFPGMFDGICVSPCYGNRMADHHNANDPSERITYKHKLGRDLSEDNSGSLQWGQEYRYWHTEAWEAILPYLGEGGTFVFNCKDHYRKWKLQRVTNWHVRMLQELGLRLTKVQVVKTRGMRKGANRNLRTETEFVITLKKP